MCFSSMEDVIIRYEQLRRNRGNFVYLINTEENFKQFTYFVKELIEVGDTYLESLRDSEITAVDPNMEVEGNSGIFDDI